MKKPLIPLIAAVLFAAGPLVAQTPTATPPAAPVVPAGQLTHDQVIAAKQATAYLVNGDSSGTAFCISESGLFITCNHVVENARPGSLAIVLSPAEKDEKKYPARVVRTFPKSDLAVLKVDLDRKVPVLKLGDETGIFETQLLFAFGFPFGAGLAHDEKSFPAVSVNLGHVTALRRNGNSLEAIQLDAALNPGDSGGPVLDDKGEVVGIVSSGVYGSGVNFAIPVSLLKMEMNAPVVSVDSPDILFEKRFEPAAFAISVDWLAPPAAEPAVSLEITGGGQTHSVAAAKGSDGKYHASLPPLIAKPAAEKIKLHVVLEFENGTVTGQVDDFPISIQGKPTLLSKIQVIKPADKGTGFQVDGNPAGALPELAQLHVDIGGAVTTVDGTKAKSIGIVAPSQDPGPVTYKVTVSVGGATLASSEGKIRIGSIPIATAPSQLKGSTTNLTEAKSFDLPSAADDVVAAQDGRSLIFHLKDVNKLVVFDVVDLKIRGYIDLAGDPVFFAGGSRYVLVAYPSQHLIVRYLLQTLQKDRTITEPMDGEIKNLVMGYSSQRYALFVTTGNSPAYPIVSMFDVNNMTVAASSKDDRMFAQLSGGGSAMIVRASGDGSTYGFYRLGVSPTGFSIVSYKNDHLSFFYKHESPGVLVPNADGSLIYSSMQGVFTPEYVSVVKENGGWSKGVSLLPAYQPAYSIGVPFEESQDEKKAPPVSIAVYMGRSDQPLTYLDGFNEMTNKDASLHSSGLSALTPDKRYHFYPQLNLFITIPATNDRLVAHPVDIKKVLDDKGVDYLYVTTVPPATRISQHINFKLEAVSKAGGVSFSLQSGPAGLTVSSDGTVNWQTPAKPTEASVIVSAKDTSGREIFYTFKLIVTN